MPFPRDAPLPEPTAEERVVSAEAQATIRREIEKRGTIPFSRFMELALYQPAYGYYTGGKEKIGSAGDFITAPEAYPLFSRCLARAIAPVLAQLGTADILEVGAGSGKLAATVLNELRTLGCSPNTYKILDLSPDLRRRQQATIATMAPTTSVRIEWLDQLPARGFRGVIIANELLDAMPVERFRTSDDGVKQLHVGAQDDGFTWREMPANDAINQRVQMLQLAPGYVSEIGFAAEAWVRSVADRLEAGVLLLIDYGFPRAEFYHPDRSSGTLMCHYRHRAHSDPLRLVGLQDITAHVDFAAIAEAGTESGLELLGYTSQAAFLIGAGLPSLAAESNPNDTRQHLAMTEQIKKLTLPHEMGELFKVMALGRGVTTFVACDMQDRRARL